MRMRVRGGKAFFEWVGALGVLSASAWGVFHLESTGFLGPGCTDSEPKLLTAPAPGGSHTVKTFYRQCGASSHVFFVNIDTGNPEGYDYVPVVELQDVAPGEAQVRWNGPHELAVQYPSAAKIVTAEAKDFDVRLLMNPRR